VVTRNLLITGRPGSGKTTLIRRLAERLVDYSPVGFYTAEVREGGVRVGFDLVSLTGERRCLAHTGLPGPYRVGRYGVDVLGFEEFLSTIPFFAPDARLVIIDEIGKMEWMLPLLALRRSHSGASRVSIRSGPGSWR
jgi:nucleoside-triphosphatase